MKALFVHDHKFPKKNNEFYFSYGFDKEFFNRYLEIVDEFEILARESNGNSGLLSKVNKNINFTTLKKYTDFLNKEIRSEIDTIINNNDFLIVRLPSILGIYSIVRAEKFNKPYIIELVGCPWDAYMNNDIKKIWFAPIITYLVKKYIKKASHVVYVTNNFLQKRYPTNGKSISCSNVFLPKVDKKDLYNRIKKIEKMDNFKSTRPKIIGTCGTIDAKYKGQEYVIKAISQLKSEGFDFEYQLVGGGDQSYLKSVAEKYNVTDKINFIGELEHKKVYEWLENIDIYVQPSLTEGLPRTVIEALSKGCPICGSNAGGIPELIDNKFVFEKKNVEDICKKIKKFDYKSMLIQSKKNFNESKNYVKDKLYDKRKKFFSDFIKDKIKKESDL